MTKNELKKKLVTLCEKDIKSCSYEELYTALLKITEEESAKKVYETKGRKLYYISAEFLIGKLLSNNLINLGLYDDVKSILESNGMNMAKLEEIEPEPSLGNGGLGRLASCFLDSLATLNLPGDGIGLRYHCGLFRQTFENKVQTETPDFWISNDSWAKKTETVYPVSTFPVQKVFTFKGMGTVNNLIHKFFNQSTVLFHVTDISLFGKLLTLHGNLLHHRCQSFL